MMTKKVSQMNTNIKSKSEAKRVAIIRGEDPIKAAQEFDKRKESEKSDSQTYEK